MLRGVIILEGHPKPPGSEPPPSKASHGASGRSSRPAPNRSAGETRARRRGRRLVMIAYYVVIAAFILLAAGNVTWQVWAPALRSYRPVDCRAGLRDLAAAIERARQAAGSFSESGEDAALARFRSELAPEWDRHDEVAASCQSNRDLAVALDVIERLRYAEERAVRREVTDLAPLRRKVGQIWTNQLEQ